jgi:hypothetical protein
MRQMTNITIYDDVCDAVEPNQQVQLTYAINQSLSKKYCQILSIFFIIFASSF